MWHVDVYSLQINPFCVALCLTMRRIDQQEPEVFACAMHVCGGLEESNPFGSSPGSM